MGMTDQAVVPVVKDIVLVGGGHSHVHVLKSFGMKPLPGVRLTLISRDVSTPYSGMLPGYIAGHYEFDDCHIDLHPLARFAGATLIHDAVTSIDTKSKTIQCANHPDITYDIVSIDVGITPASDVSGVKEFTTPVKPIDSFSQRWHRVLSKIESSSKEFRLVVVGGGAGGVELCLAMQYRLLKAMEDRNIDKKLLIVSLITRGGILPTHNWGVRRIFRRVFKERGVDVVEESTVTEVKQGSLQTEKGESIPFDECIWCTQAAGASWLKGTGLPTDSAGCLVIDDKLVSTGDPCVFAAGDCASNSVHPRPKAGVFAVRQGPPLAENLRRHALGQDLLPFVPQTAFLGLISTGDKNAILSRSQFFLEGTFLWMWKDSIDRKWMEKYTVLPEMATHAKPPPEVAVVAGEKALSTIAALPMRCGGCGSKVGPTILSRVIERLHVEERKEVLIGLKDPDDAAVVKLPEGTVAVQTVDFFRSFINDPYVFGQVAANHALSDIHAMGAEALSALALATVPFGLEEKVEEDLYHIMAGALKILNESKCALVGGHTTEGPELSLGFAVTGAAMPGDILRKEGLEPGQQIILTKPLGTGALFAADMRSKAKGRWIAEALASMTQTNYRAAVILRKYGSAACTDVTGFGLLGHLVEMTKASQVRAQILLQELPVFEGFEECVKQGIFSSLQPQNLRLRRALLNLEEVAEEPLYPVLFDPQTAGGLLAAVPKEVVGKCVEELHQAGYKRASIIGEVGGRTHTDSAVDTIEIIGQPARAQ